MPDQYGRLTRLELRDAVRRRVDGIRFTVNQTTGDEAAVAEQFDPLVSNEDINLFLNTAIIKRSVDVNIADNTIMADQVIIDVVTGQTEYALPEDVMFLRAVYWKPVTQSIVTIPLSTSERIMMWESDQDNDIDAALIQGFMVPTYRRRLNMLVLNQIPEEDNTQGILIDYTKAFLTLAADDQVIETPLAQIIQELVILDATVEIVTTRMRLDATEIRQTMAELEKRLILAVENYHAPKTIRLMNSGTIVVNPPNSRRSWRWQRRTWW